MSARDHTERMLRWWRQAGVDRTDLAVRREDGAMLWHRDRPVSMLPLAWARALNVRRADVYARPARGSPWPLLFLDDVPSSRAVAVAHKYAALVVRTSAAGGCHIWLRTSVPLAESQRRDAQRYLARRLGADMGSVSGEHLGRLAGFRNWKRQGVWVNVLWISELEPWQPAPALSDSPPSHPRQRHRLCPDSGSSRTVTTDTSASGADWAFTLGLLEAGCPPHRVHERLVARARARRGTDVERYATQTLRSALSRLAG